MAFPTKRDAERGPIGSWMRSERVARGWSVADVSHELAAAGAPVSQATIRQYEAGPRQPGVALLGALVDLYGSEPATTAEQPSDIDRLSDAIDRLTVALGQRGR